MILGSRGQDRTNYNGNALKGIYWVSSTPSNCHEKGALLRGFSSSSHVLCGTSYCKGEGPKVFGDLNPNP